MKFFLSVLLVVFAFAKEGEYLFKDSEININSMSLNSFFTKKGAPYVYTSSKCSKGQKPVCWPVIKNNEGRTLRSYGTKDSVGTIMNGRYKNIAYLLYSHTYKAGKNYKTDYYLIDNKGNTYNIPNYISALDSIITKDVNILQIAQDGVYLNGNKKVQSPFKLVQAKIGNNLEGDISIIAIDDKNEIITSNTNKFINTTAKLTAHGDRGGILSTYPVNNSLAVWSVYKYVNSYNKGLLLGKVDFNSNQSFYGWVFNSELRNVGFNPEIFVDNGIVYIATKDSSNRDKVVLSTPLNKIEEIVGITPKHILGFEEEDKFSFLVGTSASYLYWDATNEVEDEDGNSYGKVNYDISESLYTAVYLEGRAGNTQLAISYMKNKAEKKGGKTAKASKFLNAVIDFNSLFSGSSTLRILAEKGEVNGIANWDGIDIYGNPVVNKEFSTKIDRYAALVMKEKGYYWGFDYTKYEMPSLLGFSKDGDIKFVLFDPETKIQKLTIDFGYDELSYAKRYENNFNRWYIQGLIGAGVALVDMSDSYDEAEKEAKAKGYDGIENKWSFALDYGLDMGYIFQRKSKTLHGFGFSTQIGIKAKGTYYLAGTTSKNSDSSDSNKLSLDFERNDIWYGPYVTFNIVF